ncbi:MAG: recombinase RecT [Peptoniphilaceae bacterium]|nr:recombinase RecT [Peptoniphilaceae bacterium]MDY3075978.1 recombinase RecT [Peptoniphilaceae bacterium]
MTTNAKSALAAKQHGGKISATDNMRGLLHAMGEQIRMALPENIQSERFQRVALTAFSGNPKLQKADPVSFIAAMMQSAQLGLEPNTPLGQAYLIPYGNQIQFQIGYKGLIDLALRSGKYRSIYAHEVRENDEFSIEYGIEETIKHVPNMVGDRGEVTGYYAVYKLENGGYGMFYMTKKEVMEHARKFSKTFNNGPWKTDFDAMAKKTVLKQVLKYAPMSIELQQATSIDENVMDSKKAQEALDENVIDVAWQSVEELEESEPAPSDVSQKETTGFFEEGFHPIEGSEV